MTNLKLQQQKEKLNSLEKEAYDKEREIFIDFLKTGNAKNLEKIGDSIVIPKFIGESLINKIKENFFDQELIKTTNEKINKKQISYKVLICENFIEDIFDFDLHLIDNFAQNIVRFLEYLLFESKEMSIFSETEKITNISTVGSSITYEDLENLIKNFKGEVLNAKFVFNHEAIKIISHIKDKKGHYILKPCDSVSGFNSLMGHEVIEFNYIQKNKPNNIVGGLVDFSAIKIIEDENFKLKRSQDIKEALNEVIKFQIYNYAEILISDYDSIIQLKMK